MEKETLTFFMFKNTHSITTNPFSSLASCRFLTAAAREAAAFSAGEVKGRQNVSGSEWQIQVLLAMICTMPKFGRLDMLAFAPPQKKMVNR